MVIGEGHSSFKSEFYQTGHNPVNITLYNYLHNSCHADVGVTASYTASWEGSKSNVINNDITKSDFFPAAYGNMYKYGFIAEFRPHQFTVPNVICNSVNINWLIKTREIILNSGLPNYKHARIQCMQISSFRLTQ